jgi:predicted small metal-binding protein
MARTFECADLGADCPGRFTTPNDEELWKHVELHVSEAHPGLELSPEFTEKARSVFKISGEG